MNKIILLMGSFVLLLLVGCGSTNDPEPPTALPNNGFESNDVAKVFAENCTESGCHAGTNPQNGLSLESYSSLIKGSSLRPGGGAGYGGGAVIPFDSENSLLYKMISGSVTPQMPFGKSALTQNEINTVKNWIDNGAKNYKGKVSYSNPSYRVFVCNQGSDKISVIDGDQKVVAGIANTDFITGTDSPHMVKELGDYYYVTLISSGRFLKIRKADNKTVGELSGLEIPGMIQIHHSGTKAYVSRSSSGTGDYNGIYVIDIENMNLLTEVTLTGGVPHGIVLHPDASEEKLYVANLTKNQIHTVNTVTEEQEDLFQFSSNQEPMQLNISPDGNHLYISARATSKILMWDTKTKEQVYEVATSPKPMHIAVRSDNSKIYVSTMGNSSVEVISKTGNAEWQSTNKIAHPAFSMLHGCDITSDDKYLYVSSRNLNGKFVPRYKPTGSTKKIANVGIIDTDTEKVIKVIEIEEYGAGLVVEKKQN